MIRERCYFTASFDKRSEIATLVSILYPITMNLHRHHNIARYTFWIAQAMAVLSSAFLLIFIGGTLISELINQVIDIKEDYGVFLFFFSEALVAVAIIISWKRKRRGPVLMLALTILIMVIWGREDLNIVLLHLPLLFSGLLLLFYSYYKEWILKRKA